MRGGGGGACRRHADASAPAPAAASAPGSSPGLSPGPVPAPGPHPLPPFAAPAALAPAPAAFSNPKHVQTKCSLQFASVSLIANVPHISLCPPIVQSCF